MYREINLHLHSLSVYLSNYRKSSSENLKVTQLFVDNFKAFDSDFIDIMADVLYENIF